MSRLNARLVAGMLLFVGFLSSQITVAVERQPANLLLQVEHINTAVNRMAYATDQTLWGEADYWASSQEFYDRGAGDCEDFALAKYQHLRNLGIAEQQLSLVYVRRLENYAAHMVLVYEQGGQRWVLDNFEPRLLAPSARRDLLPVYQFNLASSDVEYLKADWQLIRRVPAVLERLQAWRHYQQSGNLYVAGAKTVTDTARVN